MEVKDEIKDKSITVHQLQFTKTKIDGFRNNLMRMSTKINFMSNTNVAQ